MANRGLVPATNTAIVAAPAHADPDVSARASMDRVIPHGTRMVARPSRAGASAEEDRARPRTKRSHEAGGSMRRLRNPGTRSWASPNATTSRPALIWARGVMRTDSCTAPPLPLAPPLTLTPPRDAEPWRTPPPAARVGACWEAGRRLPPVAGMVAARWRVTRPVSRPPCTAAQDTPPANRPVIRTAPRFTQAPRGRCSDADAAGPDGGPQPVDELGPGPGEQRQADGHQEQATQAGHPGAVATHQG